MRKLTVHTANRAISAAFFVVMEDAFLGAWGRECGQIGPRGKSLYAIACDDEVEAQVVKARAMARQEMSRVRIVKAKLRHGQVLPAIQAGPDDHLTVVDKSRASSYFIPLS